MKDALRTTNSRTSQRPTAEQQTTEALRASEARYKALYDDNPSMYFTVDADGKVLSVNRYGAEQLGYTVGELVGQSVLTVFHQEDKSAAKHHLETCLTQPNAVHQWELRKVRKDGSGLWVKETARAIGIPGHDPIVLIVCEDITKRRRAETKLRESEERYRTVVEDIPALVCRFLPDGILTFVNEHYCQYFDKTQEELKGQNFFQFVPEEERANVQGHFAALTPAHPTVTYEHKVLAPDGTERWQRWTDRALFDGDSRALEYQSIGEDITEHRQTEERLREYQTRLRALVSEISLGEERERRRIAADLHDLTVQNLGLSRFKVAALRKSLSAGDQSPLLDEIQAITEQTIRDTRSLVFELSPPVLYELGFEPAIEWLAERMQEKYKFVCEVENDQQPKPLAKDLEIVLFQAVRELLTNIGKHAKASKAKVSLQAQAKHITINVEDDGAGFGPQASAEQSIGPEGFGLFSIRERLFPFGGRLEVNAAPRGGTRVTLVVPVSSAG